MSVGLKTGAVEFCCQSLRKDLWGMIWRGNNPLYQTKTHVCLSQSRLTVLETAALLLESLKQRLAACRWDLKVKGKSELQQPHKAILIRWAGDTLLSKDKSLAVELFGVHVESFLAGGLWGVFPDGTCDLFRFHPTEGYKLASIVCFFSLTIFYLTCWLFEM